MNESLTINIFTRSKDLPSVIENNFFHSKELFVMLEKARGLTPYMVVVFKGNVVVSQLLATLRRRGSLLPPYLFTQGRVYGEGEYTEGADKEELFSLMLAAITRHFKRRMCLNIEFSDLSHKMFGYKYFRKQGYFPVQWLEIHNSLHTKSPREWITEKMEEKIARVEKSGMLFMEVEKNDDFRNFYKLIHRFYSWKLRRFLPSERLFAELKESQRARLFVTYYKNKAIGACACVYHKNDAYLWYLAAKRKSHPKLHPDIATIWGAINDAYNCKCRHFYFMDVGLPFRANPYSDFILSFGGKEVSTYRWFRFTFSWLNKFIGWFYRE